MLEDNLLSGSFQALQGQLHRKGDAKQGTVSSMAALAPRASIVGRLLQPIRVLWRTSSARSLDCWPMRIFIVVVPSDSSEKFTLPLFCRRSVLGPVL